MLIVCPGWHRELKEWQGTDGACGMFVWKQGTKKPIDQLVEPELRDLPWPDPKLQLPASFTITATECSCPYIAEATGYVVSGTWQTIELLTIANARQREEETRAQWSARRKWLESCVQ